MQSRRALLSSVGSGGRAGRRQLVAAWMLPWASPRALHGRATRASSPCPGHAGLPPAAHAGLPVLMAPLPTPLPSPNLAPRQCLPLFFNDEQPALLNAIQEKILARGTQVRGRKGVSSIKARSRGGDA